LGAFQVKDSDESLFYLHLQEDKWITAGQTILPQWGEAAQQKTTGFQDSCSGSRWFRKLQSFPIWQQLERDS